jgi:cytochrome P450
MTGTTVAEAAEGDLTPHRAATALLTPATFADPVFAFRCGDVLREQSPFHRIEHPEYDPLTIVSRHADIYEVEVHDQVFANSMEPILAKKHRMQARAEGGQQMHTVITMNAPVHAAHRGLLAPAFRPSALRALQPRLEELAVQAVDRMVEKGGECDFATEVAVGYPLQVILSLLGLPEEDYPRMLRLTQQLFNPDDPELGRGDSPEDIRAVFAEFFGYFSDVMQDRMASPRQDLASGIANGQIDGCPITAMEKLGHYIVLATAGHDTTSSALAGGLEALLRHPDQLDLLRARPELLNQAVEEILRWVTPVKHFLRTATEPFELGDHRFEPGDIVYMSYVGANRDPRVFEDPYRFDITRTPNRHLAFGFGAHFCIGANLARTEVRVVLAELLRRLQSIELVDEPAWTHATAVSGPKRLRVRYEPAS